MGAIHKIEKWYIRTVQHTYKHNMGVGDAIQSDSSVITELVARIAMIAFYANACK